MTEQKHVDDLKSLTVAQVQQRLGTSKQGLSQAEAATRLATYGPNEIAEHKTNRLLNFLAYFWGPIPWMIDPRGSRAFGTVVVCRSLSP